MNEPDVLIIGSGPAGLTAGIYAGRAGLSVSLLTGAERGGKLNLTDNIENYPGFSSISGYDLMAAFEKQAAQVGVNFFSEQAQVTRFSETSLIVETENQIWHPKSVIIASGSKIKWLNIPGEERFKGKGISVCATCDGFFYKNKDVAIIGGGNTALYEAVYLANLAKNVYILTPYPVLHGEYFLRQKLLKFSNVQVLYNTDTISFEGNKKLNGIKIKNKASTEEKIIAVDGCFEAIGFVPNSALFSGQLFLDKKGYIKTNKTTMQTSVPGVFACGDVQEKQYRQAIIACASGARAAMSTEIFLKSKKYPKILF